MGTTSGDQSKRDNENFSLSANVNSIKREIHSFHVGDLRRTGNKCTKVEHARAEPLFCTLVLGSR